MFWVSHGARNCPFLTFTGLPVLRGGDDQIGLTAEESRNLEHIEDLGAAFTSSTACTSDNTGTPTASLIFRNF